MKKILMIICLLFMAGCSEQLSTITYKPPDANVPYVFTGKAADTIAAKIAENVQTKEGRINELLDVTKKYFGWLFLTLIGGLVFWGFTRSRYGWVIPAASIGGMVLIITFNSIAGWIPYIVVAIGLGLVVWKAIEYQQERNNETTKRLLQAAK